MMKAVLFDMDGVLFDTEALGKKTFYALGKKYGYTAREGFYETTVGLTDEAARDVYLRELGDDFRYDSFCHDFFSSLLEHGRTQGMPEKPGALMCLRALKEMGLGLALATSNSRAVVDGYFTHSSLSGLFDAIICGVDVARSKPAPDIYLEAARRVGAPPESCVGVEDSYNGVRSLRAAGVVSVMIPDILPYVPALAEHVDHVLPSLRELPALVRELMR